MSDDNLWFKIGYQLEKARLVTPRNRVRGLAERVTPTKLDKDGDLESTRPEPAPQAEDRFDALLVVGGTALASRLLSLWPARRRPGVLGLVKAGAAGAGAALLTRLVGPLLHRELAAPELGDDLSDALMAGAARGLVYAAIVEPRLALPPLGWGLLYGSVEYLASPWGGLPALLGKEAPHRRIPFLAAVFEGYDPEDDAFIDHVAFAVALALLYGQAGLGESELLAE